jgi:DNA primase
VAIDPIQEIKDRADIVELISGIIPVKKSGANYVAVCPFHNDTKPSMHISSSKGIFKCFACGAGGDIFKFWSDYYQKDFKETLKELAQKYGVELVNSSQNKEEIEHYNLQIRMHELAAKYYNDQLLGSEQALLVRIYLENRKISTNTISEYKLGYSPADPENWGKLITLLKDKLNVTEPQIVEAGLALQSEKNSRYFDRFRGRLMIPIRDERGRVIAFGARLIPGMDNDNGPKYLNSPDTQTYHKGETLFGIDLAKEFIRKEDAVIIVEGYFDQIALYQAGIKNALANQGTALTAKQVKTMSKFTSSKRIYLCFDSDSAGDKASDRAAEIIAQVLGGYQHETRILQIPEVKDADEFIQKNGNEKFRDLLKQAPLLIDYKIQQSIQTVDLNSPQSKAKAIKDLSKYLNYITNKIELSEYTRIIASKLQIEETALAGQLETELASQSSHDNPYQDSSKTQAPNIIRKQNNGHIMYAEKALYAAEQEVIILALNERKLLEEFLKQESQLITETHRKILDALIDISFENPDINNPEVKFALVANRLSSEFDLSKAIADIGVKLETRINNDDNEERYHESISKLNIHRVEQELSLIKKEQLTLNDADPKWEDLERNKRELEKEKQRLLNARRQIVSSQP